ncbi:hypothetical protein COI30_00520 [Neisseria meningitidis]|nr:hypothetical protein COI38_00940 [Neisseria meningitidis]RNK02063.1 hypothetical protein COI29_02395 [Neisseria meningitidis]RNK02648.1 hypothetical protein COI30_00520 [Neisseria meningitidis]RNK07091.1 hypothetical protein COI26_03965 [Neisseria meningitidis]RNK17566.1 hypothetical protein COI23_00365 [Neisseria meningitidis]
MGFFIIQTIISLGKPVIVYNRHQPLTTIRYRFFYGMFCGIFYSGLTKTSTALPRLSSKRTIL